MAQILKGAPVVAAMNEANAARCAALKEKGIVPTLAVVRVGAREDDISYEKGIVTRCGKVGVEVRQFHLAEDVTQEELLDVIRQINGDASVHGCLIFRPLPKRFDDRRVQEALAPEKDVDGITQVVSLDSITGPGFDTELLPDSVMEILQSGGYKLILANSSYKTGTDAINSQLDEMISLIKNVDPEGVITGEGAMTKDLIEVADVDFKNVNVWSIMAVLVIIAISFKSISIPVLLVASIEAAIAINMGIPYFTGTQLPFIASIVIGTIQLGATVDYSILMTTRYHEERAFGRTPKEAAQQSLEHCSQSILTSGLTFFAATVGVAAISKMELLRSICLLISRGALISMLVILVVLPAALMLCDWLIRHTTLKWMVPESANAKKSEKE